ncbi:tripartite tricarboxylate transporter substrate binding protein [Thermoflavimicrobium dichotomicum]|uniref:Putative tricarboxylic transport membrane protein n=1 Tax=Thermoflavimicrobium dichotomicum TaxID=46223 RepID=A0A1I3Q648_9BACL|nr:tripartite tricarboxylate transporter substrate binding protein [Thermoflavimicrobium dichotomicum]SFJ29348.1 putative tricarboxylic transport membrane protein [Thermoflavimicrobium dichotomicum]
MKKLSAILLPGVLALGLAACSQKPNFGNSGKGYPEKPITVVAPSGAGGGWDQTARSITKVLQDTKLVNQPLTVENKPGGGGAVFLAEYATQDKKNPYKLFVNSPPIIINNLKKEGNSPFGIKDVTPLAQLTKDYGAIVVKNDSPIKDLPSALKELKANPQKYTLAGGSAPGSMDHLIAVLPAFKSGVDIKKLKYVSYDGGGEAMAALLGGNADIIATDVSGVVEYKKSGKVRVLAVTAPQRLPGEFKDVPTLKELGMKDADFIIWRGVFGPKEMPDEAKKYWEEKLKALSEKEEWKKELEAKGWVSEYRGSVDFTAFLKKQEEQVLTLLKALGMNK